LFIGDVDCTTAINVFEPCALNLSFNILYLYFLKIHYFATWSLELEKGLGDKRKAPSRVKGRSLYEKLQYVRFYFLIPCFI
jgi:hypothetical protein